MGNFAVYNGGGAFAGKLVGCVLTENCANYGGGVGSAQLYNCVLTRNSAILPNGYGGGADRSTLNNCTVSGNMAVYGGGVCEGVLTNCIVYYNTSISGQNYDTTEGGFLTFDSCCTTPLPPGANNLSSDPLLASASHLSQFSPCIARGNVSSTTGADIDGDPWFNPPCIGADQFVAGMTTRALAVAISATYTNVAVGFSVDVTAQIDGRLDASVWNFGDGTVISNQPYSSHAWNTPGLYPVLLTAYGQSYPLGLSATVMVRVVSQPVYYVNCSNSTPAYPFANWATAARTIQQAIDAGSLPGRLVLVTNGVYETGASTADVSTTNRVTLTNSVLVQSVNGPEVTWIVGSSNEMVRCAYVGSYAGLSGFTLTNGYTQGSGGGAYGELSGTITNCVITGNWAYWFGGGTYSGRLKRCLLLANYAGSGGAAFGGVFDNCIICGNQAVYGGGTYSSFLNNCVLTNNVGNQGGGAICSMINNSILIGNVAWNGGGAALSTLNNCTVINNTATYNGGISDSISFNSIVYYNSGTYGSNCGGTYNVFYSHTCTTPLVDGIGNITDEPMLFNRLAGNVHLLTNSPCVDAGNDEVLQAGWLDMDGNPRMFGQHVDIGAYECQTTLLQIMQQPQSLTNYLGTVATFTVGVIGPGQIQYQWQFNDSNIVGATSSILVLSNLQLNNAGQYSVIVSNATQSVTSQVATLTLWIPRFVWPNSPNPTAPYTNWQTAARTIQAAVDDAQPNDVIVVTNGIYNTGGKAVYGTMTNRVALDRGVTVQSVNGPEVTWIMGAGSGGNDTNGDGAIRCAYVGSNAWLIGFTLTNGHTRSKGDAVYEQSGGGAWVANYGVVSNCILSCNSADYSGGGGYGYKFYNCIISNNTVFTNGGGVCSANLYNCLLVNNKASIGGGGAYNSSLFACTVRSNLTSNNGGGAYGGTLSNSTIQGNTALLGGGTYSSTLYYCYVTSNTASSGGGGYLGTNNYCIINRNYATNSGGGAYGGTLSNSTIQENSTLQGGGTYSSTLYYCYVISNSASSGGGGFLGAINNCIINRNYATNGAGIYNSTLKNCTVTENAAKTSGGGSYGGTLYNCIVYYNTAANYSNYYSGTINYSCTAPLPAGTGNISTNPLLASITHLAASSPCIDKGLIDYVSGTDIDGEAWLNPPCMGADQYASGPATGSLSVAISSVTGTGVNYSENFTAQIEGRLSASVWNFGDGTIVSNQLCISHAWGAPGIYPVQLTGYNASNPGGITATVMVSVVKQAYYVDANSVGPISPYTNWATAARTIQEAVDAAVPGNLVLVNSGIYNTGGKAVSGSTMTNRLAINKAIVVQSLNGPGVTLIAGQGSNGCVGPGAIRCAYVGTNAVLSGFTLTNGFTLPLGEYGRYQSGGGAYCEPSGMLSNCVVAGNTAAYQGGGVFQGTLQNCVLYQNSALMGGGACSNLMNNCSVSGNCADATGGGAYQCTINNCIVYYNRAARDPNYYGGSCSYSCTMPLPMGIGNIEEDPLLVTRSHLSVLSPCIGRGNANYALGADIDGDPWEDPPCIGVDQYTSGASTGALTVAISAPFTNLAAGYNADFTAVIDGRVYANVWDFGDGTVLSNRVYVSHTWNVPGVYVLRLTGYNDSNPGGVSTVITVQVVNQPVYYVNANNSTPMYPYTNWTTAAVTIQTAIEAGSLPGRLVLVADGVYGNGGVPVYGRMTNRVAITDGVTVQSMNGPEVTCIVGAGSGGLTNNGDGAIRCAYLGPKAVLSGFTLTNGYTRGALNAYQEKSGGGAWCDISAVVTNCLVIGNSSSYLGGGIYGGTLINCRLIGNLSSRGGGVYAAMLTNCSIGGNSAGEGGGVNSSTLSNCSLTNNGRYNGGGSAYSLLYNCLVSSNIASMGGGAFYCALSNCVVVGNSATNSAGGVYCGTMSSCAVNGNRAGFAGGGVFEAILDNCLVVSNTAAKGGGSAYSTNYNTTLIGNGATNAGGGSYNDTLINCISYYNTAPSNANWFSNWNSFSVQYCCTTPNPVGIGNITNEPMFINLSDGNFQLLLNSPCVDAGDDSKVQSSWLDLEGKPRILGAHVDIGAYEFGSTNLQFLQPQQNITNTVGTTEKFTASVTGIGPLGYQWYFNSNALLSTQTNNILTLANLRLNDAGLYSVVVTNRSGTITGDVLKLWVAYQIPPTGIRYPKSGTNTVFHLGVQAEEGRSYWLEVRDSLVTGQWRCIAGVTNYAGTTNLLDTNAVGKHRFYRIGSASEK